MKGKGHMRQTKGKNIDEVNASGNSFLKSLLQIEDQYLSESEKQRCMDLLSQIVIHSEITLDNISNKWKKTEAEI